MKLFYLLGCLWEQFGSNPSRMGVSIEEYRQRIGCFVRVLSSFKVKGNNSNTCQKQSKDFGTAVRVIIRCVDYVIKISTIVINHYKHWLQTPCRTMLAHYVNCPFGFVQND